MNNIDETGIPGSLNNINQINIEEYEEKKRDIL